MKRNTFFLLSLLTTAIIGMLAAVSIAPNFVHADTQATTANWDDSIKISANLVQAERPSLATSPNGRTVLVAYSAYPVAGNNDIVDVKYSYSNNQGNTWTKHQNVHAHTNVISQHAHATFSYNGTAHVVWVEDSGLAYANSSNLSSGFGNYKYFTNTSGSPGSLDPVVITYGNHVHILWAFSDGAGGVDIKHVHSTNGGSSWGAINTITTGSFLRENPDVTVDANGNLHLVFEQQTPSPNLFNVVYLKGTVSGSTTTWATGFTDITSKIVGDGDSFVQPSIMFQNGRLEASVTQNFVNPTNAGEAPQYVYHIQCNAGCDNENNWNPTLVSTTESSDEELYLDARPYNLTTSIIKVGTCSTIIFDGKVSSTQQDREQIFHTSSCNNWGAGRQELTINDESRDIQPSAGTLNGWWVYVAYEQFVNSTSETAIFVMRNQPAVFLPVITKGN